MTGNNKNQRCAFCGHFLSTRWEAMNNHFANDSAAYCEPCGRQMPADHRERQAWIARNLP